LSSAGAAVPVANRRAASIRAFDVVTDIAPRLWLRWPSVARRKVGRVEIQWKLRLLVVDPPQEFALRRLADRGGFHLLSVDVLRAHVDTFRRRRVSDQYRVVRWKPDCGTISVVELDGEDRGRRDRP